MTSSNLERWYSRLQPPIEGIYRAWAATASKRLSNLLGSPLKIDIAQIDIAQIDIMPVDALGGESGHTQSQDATMLDYKLDVPDSSDPWILRIPSIFVYQCIDRLLGAKANEPLCPGEFSPSRTLSSIDSKVASYALEELAYPCLDAWQIETPQTSPRASLQLVDEFKRQNSIGITFRISLGVSHTKEVPGPQWQGQWLIPESLVKRQFGRLVFGSDQPVVLHAILARSTIQRSELEQLEVGDIISTEQLASQAAEVACRGLSGNMELLFRGEPGVYKGTRALRLLG